jgi:prophage maintenance system killer protein
MQRALSPPTAFFAGVGATTYASEAARLLAEIATVGALPQDNMRCAWICMLRFLELNDCRWRAEADDGAALDRFVEDILAGEPVAMELARWIERHVILPPAGVGAPGEGPTAHVHVTSAITGLSSEKRAEVDELANAIDEEIADFVRDNELSYNIGTYRPSVLPAADPDDPDTALAYADERLLKADGFVVIGACGGSLGAGIDVATALAALVPILYLHPRDEKLSPRTRALLERHGADIRRYRPGDEAEVTVRSYVHRWLEREGGALADTCRMATMMHVRVAPLWRALRKAANGVSRAELRRRLAAQRMTESHGLVLLSSVHYLALASTCQLLALGAALDVPVSLDIQGPSAGPAVHPTAPGPTRAARQTRLQPLSHQELDDLEQVSANYTGAEVAQMVRVAQEQIEAEIAQIAASAYGAVTIGQRSLWTRQRWRGLHKRLFA